MLTFLKADKILAEKAEENDAKRLEKVLADKEYETTLREHMFFLEIMRILTTSAERSMLKSDKRANA